MSAAEYYGNSGYPQQQSYNAPAQKQYASAPGQGASYNQPQYGSGPPGYQQHPQDQEKGLVATVVGGGAGGALGHKVGKGSKFKTLLGAAAGAAVANAVEHRLPGGKKHSKHGKHHGHGHHAAPHHYQQPHHGHGGLGAPAGVAGLLGSGSHHGGSSGGLLGSMSGLLGGGKPGHHQQHGHGHHGHHQGHGRW